MTRLVLIATCIALTGCFHFTTRYGDAKVTRWNAQLVGKGKSRSLALPEFGLSEPNVHRFHVVDLPVAIYPQWIVIETPWDDYVDERMQLRPPDAPWRRMLLEVVILDEDGGVVFEKSLDLSKERASWFGVYRNAPVRTSPKRTAQAKFSLFEHHAEFFLPQVLSYQVVVSVRDPSPRPGLKAVLVGHVRDISSIQRASVFERIHLRELAAAAAKFAEDHQGLLPTAQDWDSQMSDYIGDTSIPTSPLFPHGGRAFAFNEHLSQVALASLPDPSRTVLWFEINPGGPLSGSIAELPSTPRYKPGYLVAFADGYWGIVPKDDLSAVIWKP